MTPFGCGIEAAQFSHSDKVKKLFVVFSHLQVPSLLPYYGSGTVRCLQDWIISKNADPYCTVGEEINNSHRQGNVETLI